MKPPTSYSYEAERRYYARAWPAKAKPFAHLEPYFRCWLDPDAVFCGKRVLEIGAGELMASRLIATRFAPRQVVGMDLLWERMQPAVRAARPPALVALAGDCFHLPFRAAAFDVVFGNLILHQLPSLAAAVREIRRVLVPGGVYVGWEPNPFNPVILYRYFFQPHSPNQYLFWPWRFGPVFDTLGFRLTTHYFYARWPRLRMRWATSCIGLTAALDGSESP